MIEGSKISVSFFHALLIFAVLPSTFLWLSRVPVTLFAPIMFLFSVYWLSKKSWFVNIYHFLFLLFALVICCWLVVNGYGSLALFVLAGYLGLLYPLMLTNYQLRSLMQHTNIFVYLVIFCYIGVIWEFLNLSSFFQISNPSGDTSYFVPFTFYGVTEVIIRPSSIYFEPGYFGFYLICYLYCRKLLGIHGHSDKYLAIAGLVTQSATYILVLALYFTSSITVKNSTSYLNIIKWLFFLLPGVFFILSSSPMEWVFARLSQWFLEPLSSVRVLHLIELLELLRDPQVMLFGMTECNRGSEECPVIVGNILVPLLRGGVVTYIPIIGGFLYLLLLTIAKRRVEAFLGLIALTLLMTAKPLYLQYPYSLVVGVFFICILININGNKSYG